MCPGWPVYRQYPGTFPDGIQSIYLPVMDPRGCAARNASGDRECMPPMVWMLCYRNSIKPASVQGGRSLISLGVTAGVLHMPGNPGNHTAWDPFRMPGHCVCCRVWGVCGARHGNAINHGRPMPVPGMGDVRPYARECRHVGPVPVSIWPGDCHAGKKDTGAALCPINI